MIKKPIPNKTMISAAVYDEVVAKLAEVTLDRDRWKAEAEILKINFVELSAASEIFKKQNGEMCDALDAVRAQHTGAVSQVISAEQEVRIVSSQLMQCRGAIIQMARVIVNLDDMLNTSTTLHAYHHAE